MDEAGLATVRQGILSIEARGSTALGPAMVRALEVLERAERGDTEIAHILLLSDGLAGKPGRDTLDRDIQVKGSLVGSIENSVLAL